MIQYACDTCGRVKKSDETWILGFAAENVGVTSARREVTIAPVWDDRRATEWLAVHFCSQRCKNEYLTTLFGEEVMRGETGTKTGSKAKLLRMGRRRHAPATATVAWRRRG
jgi:hypothetical protein